MPRLLISLLLALTLIGSATAANGAAEPEWESRLTLPPLFTLQRAEEGSRGSVLWPFFHWERVNSDIEWGLRPLIHWQRNLPENRIAVDLLWPLIRYDRDGEELDWRIFPLFGGWLVNQTWGDPDRYFTLFPLIWLQRDPAHSMAVIPPYMRIREAEQTGEVRFDALLPFFRASDERTGEVVTSLFPVIWGTEHGELAEFHIFPFLWHWRHGNARFNALFPLWGEFRRDAADGSLLQRHRMILPPLWIESVGDGGESWRRNLLWPFIAWGRGENSQIIRVLPLFSHQRYSQSGRDFHSSDLVVLPPLMSLTRHWEGEELYERNFNALLFWNWWKHDFSEREKHSWGLFPLINGGSIEGVGSHLSIFDPLFFFEGTEAHRRLAVLWRIFHHRASDDGEEVETELLWRFFHRERHGDRTRTSLFPFIAIEREPERSRSAFLWRLFEIAREPDGRFVRILFSPRIRIGGGTTPTTP